MTAPILCENVVKKFGRNEVLKGVNLAVPQSSIYALVGPNGTGKTTLLKILANILRATRGTAELLGRDSRRLGPRDFARIGYVSESQHLPGWMTVQYFMNYLKPFYPGWEDQLASELMDELHLPRERKVKHLSRGMQMKTALAASLAYRPQVILLDEPLSGLDALAREEFVQGLLKRIDGATVLISSHDLADLESFATHVGFLSAGKIQFSEELQSLSQRYGMPLRDIFIKLAREARSAEGENR